MDMNQAKILLPFFFLILTTCRSSDTIAVHQNISDGDIIVSENAMFELGFFSPGNSRNRYLGIWFKNATPFAVAWVANRENPVTDNSGVVRLNNQGNLTLVNGSGKVLWSSNSSSSSSAAVSGTNTNFEAQLLYSGNLVIKNANEEGFIWQSFDYPGDTYLAGVKIGKNLITGRETYLTSWKSLDDPSPGDYTLKLTAEKGKFQQLYIRKNSKIETRLGPYNGISYSGRENYSLDVSQPTASYMVMNQDEIYFFFVQLSNTTTFRSIVTPDGKRDLFMLQLPNPQWQPIATSPVDYCDIYGACGRYGICTAATFPNCGCLQGFEMSQNDTSVCKRRKDLDCSPEEGFLKFSSVKLPDTENAVFSRNMSLQDCEIACKKDCSCTAYANPSVTASSLECLMWFGDLIDVRLYPQNGQDLFVRLAASELPGLGSSVHRSKRVVLAVALSVSLVSTLLALILAFFIRKKWKRRLNAEGEGKPGKIIVEDQKGSSSQIETAEVPLFSISEISRATDDFSYDNKLGEGGFGPVYKGVLEEGKVIAVKRLSNSSQQGFDEFKNEVMCIAKLQHRNLVKLLGYCIGGDEKMLIYEYMPNGSLDSYIFDDSRKLLLDWPQRFHIIHGIARGLLYLHQDSRLKVVHRDLKAGNILLDHDMSPKISDFGLARIFKEDESEANTKRVVGTLGYISPEYAVNGLYSVKSDIFSFGVLVLEIVSGKKNRGFAHEYREDNLLGHAWRLYNEGKSLNLMDECLHMSYSASEVLRSVHIGLLCVQQRTEDRPNTKTLVGMLDGEGSLPSPKKPAFFVQESEINSSSNFPLLSSSLNGITLSQVEGR